VSGARIRITGGLPLRGAVELPPDALIAQVALVLHALADGDTSIHGDLRGARHARCCDALRALGVAIDAADTEVRVHGRGLHALSMPRAAVDCGPNPIALALLAGVCSGQRFGTRLTLDASADRRPLDDLIGALQARGAQIAANGRSGASLRAPISIAPLLEDERLAGIECALPASDPLAKAALLTSGLFSPAPTSVSEPLLSPDHVERMLSALGVPLRRIGSMAGFDPAAWQGALQPSPRVELPADTTLASFVSAAASAIPDSRVALGAVGMNPTRSGFFDALRLLGARLLVVAKGDRAGHEPIAEVQVRASTARGGAIGGEITARAGDGLPALLLLGARSRRGLSLHDGESFAPAGDAVWDELAALVGAFGAACAVQDAGLSVASTPQLRAAHVDAREDRRLALTAVIFGLAAEGETVIDNAADLARDDPGLFDALRRLGARVDVDAAAGDAA
jgi:3-phosphoshikimate 1-carboxyvinyltransferase